MPASVSQATRGFKNQFDGLLATVNASEREKGVDAGPRLLDLIVERL